MAYSGFPILKWHLCMDMIRQRFFLSRFLLKLVRLSGKHFAPPGSCMAHAVLAPSHAGQCDEEDSHAPITVEA